LWYKYHTCGKTTTCAKSKPAKELAQEQLERFNRARDFYGDPLKRWNDRFTPERTSYVEEYCRGRMALVLDCNFPVVGVAESDAARFAKVVGRSFEGNVLVILKANVAKLHKLQYWDKHLMLVPDIQLVKAPEGGISSLVGFNHIEDKRSDWNGNLLFFQSTIQPGYKFIPRIEDWESRPLGGLPAAMHDDDPVVEMVKGASQIVESISDGKSGVVHGESGFIDIDSQKICSLLRVILNAKTVEVRLCEGAQQRIQICDVLVGPFNLEP
jgi:hypothetical protein